MLLQSNWHSPTAQFNCYIGAAMSELRYTKALGEILEGIAPPESETNKAQGGFLEKLTINGEKDEK